MSDRPFDKFEARTVTAQMEARMLKAMTILTIDADSVMKDLAESEPNELADVVRMAMPEIQADLDKIKQSLAIWDAAHKSLPVGCTEDDIKWRRIP